MRTGTAALLSAVEIWSTPSQPAAETLAKRSTEANASSEQKITTEQVAIEKIAAQDAPAPQRQVVPSLPIVAEARPAASEAPLAKETPALKKPRQTALLPVIVQPLAWPPRRLSLALQGGSSFSAFTWGVLDRLLEEPDLDFDAISGASAGAVQAVLLACGLAQGGRVRAQALLRRFWTRTVHDASFRSLMLVGGFSPAGSSISFGQSLRSGQFDPFDLDPLRLMLERDIDFTALTAPAAPKLLIAATRVRDGRQQIFRNKEISADVVLASTCPPLIHCTVELDGESYWDGGYGSNPPVLSLAQDTEAPDVLVVQVTPSRDNYIPITLAAIDRRLDQITANTALNAEINAVEWARAVAGVEAAPRIFRIAAEDSIDGLAQRSAVDLGRGFVGMLHRHGYDAADRWLRPLKNARSPSALPRQISAPELQPA
jgi:NTE family protein